MNDQAPDNEASPYHSLPLFLHGEPTMVLLRQRNRDGVRCNESSGNELLYARQIRK
jgi:hypothetical protein